MDEIINYSNINTVEELTNVINTELHKAAVSFVRVGYLLKRARDEEILKKAGYPDIYAYASAKFGLDKSMVSRFIRINDRFSVGGYSEHLQEKFEDFGYAKLSIMLTLPDELNSELSPDMSKSDIALIKSEYDAEQKISDMEVMMEDTSGVPDEFIAAVVKELNDEHPESATYLNRIIGTAEKMDFEVTEAVIREAYIPEGAATYIIRIPGQGRFSVDMKEAGITITSIRNTSNKSPLSWMEFKDALMEDMKDRSFLEEEKKESEIKRDNQTKNAIQAAFDGMRKSDKKKKKPEKVKPAKIKKKEKEEVAPVQQEKKVEETAKTQNEAVPERIPEEDTEIIPAEHSTDNVPPEDIQEVEEDIQEDEDIEPAAGEETKAAASEETKAAAGEKEDYLTSAQKDMLEWLELLKRKTVPKDGSRPDWVGILNEVKTMERFVKQFTY